MLLQLSARLQARHVHHRVLVDDGRGGDQLALAAELHGELVELWLERHDTECGAAWLLAEGPVGAGAFAEAIAGLGARASRLATVQRGCLLTVDALALRLAAEAEALRAGYPRAALQGLRQAFGEARPLVGLRAPLMPASMLDAHRVQPSRFTLAYGAVVPTTFGARAARWTPAEHGFTLPPAARRGLLERLGKLDRTTLTGMAIAGPVAFGLADDAREDERSFDLGQLPDCGFDPCDVASCDIGGWDMAGCDMAGCDVSGCDPSGLELSSCFDVTPDCLGSLDCIPLDCGF
ncbi:MAG: hypothetical protein KDK70_04990 [Myxococcales bacterium]|nr:hypothetical protein [Myxococcales bacterium]